MTESGSAKQQYLKRRNEFSPRLFHNVQFIRYLQVIGLALIAASFLYLIAANWLMIPKLIQLLIPMLMLLCSAIGSMYFSGKQWIQQSLDTVSGLMLGLSLAVIGQVYQTGADSYLLFLVWAVLLLPWLYRPNIGVFALFCIVSQLALWMYFKQSYLMPDHQLMYLLCMNALTAVCVTLCLKYYPALRFVFIVLISCISIYCMLLFCSYGAEQYDWLYLPLSIALPLYLIGYFYLQHRALDTSLQAAGLAASISILIFQFAEHALSGSVGGLLVLALLIFAWFAAISALLMKFLPQTKFTVIPLAIGAWLAGIILSSLLLTFWKSFSIAMGAVFVALAWWMIRRSISAFSRQFAYCLWICGQTAVLAHTQILTDSFTLILFLQIGFTLLCLLSRMHWFIILIQLIACYGLSIAAIGLGEFFRAEDGLILAVMGLNYSVLIALLCAAPYWQSTIYRKTAALWLLFIILASVLLKTLSSGFIYVDHTQHAAMRSVIAYALPLLWLGLYIGIGRQHSGLEKWLFLALGIALIAMGYFEIFLLLVLLSWSVAYPQNLVKALSIVLLIFSLWMLYYNLGLSFLLKSFSILISGVLLLAIAWMLSVMPVQITGEKS